MSSIFNTFRLYYLFLNYSASIDEWMISNEPPILVEAKLVLISSTVSDSKRVMNFELFGNSLTILNVIPVVNNTLLNWTLTPRLPEENEKQGFSVKITNGKFSEKPLIFSLTFEVFECKLPFFDNDI